MTTDVIDDLKQFISTTIGQQTLILREDLQSEMNKLEKKLSDKIDKTSADLMGFIGDALDSSNTSTDSQLEDHERRLGKLEHRTA